MYGCVPRRVAIGQEYNHPDGAGERTERDLYGFTLREGTDGDVVRDYEDEVQSPEFAVGDRVGATDDTLDADPTSWGACNVEEVLNWLLVRAWSGEVVLPGSVSQRVGVKPTFDKAPTAGARSGERRARLDVDTARGRAELRTW